VSCDLLPNDSTLERRADRINAEHQQVEGALQASLEHARTAGELLLEAKARCPHGRWLPWLKSTMRFSEATAQRYMQIASRWDELMKSRTVRDLTMRDALRLLATRPAAAPGPPAATAGGSPCTVDDLRLVGSGQRFGTIYADPPWRYDNRASRGAAENHCPTMTVEEIAALPVEKLAAPQCHLWLWVTNAFLFDCPKLFAKWGFEFKTHYVWCEPPACGAEVHAGGGRGDWRPGNLAQPEPPRQVVFGAAEGPSEDYRRMQGGHFGFR
jgi:hypothetical protein